MRSIKMRMVLILLMEGCNTPRGKGKKKSISTLTIKEQLRGGASQKNYFNSNPKAHYMIITIKPTPLNDDSHNPKLIKKHKETSLKHYLFAH